MFDQWVFYSSVLGKLFYIHCFVFWVGKKFHLYVQLVIKIFLPKFLHGRMELIATGACVRSGSGSVVHICLFFFSFFVLGGGNFGSSFMLYWLLFNICTLLSLWWNVQKKEGRKIVFHYFFISLVFSLFSSFILIFVIPKAICRWLSLIPSYASHFPSFRFGLWIFVIPETYSKRPLSN